MSSPNVRGNITKLKLVLPVGKQRAWKLIATPEGIATWLAAKCRGGVARGEELLFGWPDREPEAFRVIKTGEKRSSLRIEWRNGAELRFYLHGRLTVLTLEVHYPNTATARRAQLSELAQWAFFLSNLKSVALRGPDLRNMDPRRDRREGFID